MQKARDLRNQTFGRLKAIRPTDKRDASGSVIWECKCSCGNPSPVFVSSNNLLNGGTKSCGCLKIEKFVLSKKLNLTGQRFGRLVAIKPTEKRCQGSIVWECKCDCGEVVLVKGSSLTSGNTKSCGCLSRDVAKQRALDKCKVDCLEGTRLSHLNKTIYKHNTSGVRGVNFHKKAGKWMASITFKKKHYYLGLYDNLQEAALVRKNAEDILWQPFMNGCLGDFENEGKRTEKLEQYIRNIMGKD